MIGKEIHNFALKLWPLNRSITGEGLRETLKEISEHLPDLKIKSFKSDLKVFDWKVPEEWHVNEAYIIDPEGKKFVIFQRIIYTLLVIVLLFEEKCN